MPADSPVFSRIAIVGLGLIGGSIAFAARRAWPSTHVVAIDREAVLREALARRAIDAAGTDLSAVRDADLVVLAAPVRQNLSLLHQVAAHVSASAVLTDVGGTKRAIMDAAARLPAGTPFIGGHPLGGGARGGFEFATASLFSRRPWILTPPAGGGPPATAGRPAAIGAAVDRLSAFVTGLGAQPAIMAAADHDRLMALISHLPQLAVTALMDVVGSVATSGGLRLAGQGLIDTTRLASSPAGVWRDICATNADEIARALDLLIERLSDLRSDLQRAEIVDAMFQQAAQWRAELMKGRD
ncbi:MAG: prephenate dehydrogenase/arogenate dehydrogenase family protein [Acidobacteria bacterium]|nr:prephenate dehydrogenase/arogenate dehydrogenase family protein [Acidobacteriota bacterium]